MKHNTKVSALTKSCVNRNTFYGIEKKSWVDVDVAVVATAVAATAFGKKKKVFCLFLKKNLTSTFFSFFLYFFSTPSFSFENQTQSLEN